MSLHDAGVVAGVFSTILFVVSYLPMLVKAARTRDLSSYSARSLAVANLGNAVHTVYVVSLPIGPIWALHGFYLAATGLMMWWYLRYRRRSPVEPGSGTTGSAGLGVPRLPQLILRCLRRNSSWSATACSKPAPW